MSESETPTGNGEAEAVEAKKRDWTGDDWLVLFGLTVFAAITRFFRLGEPERLIFDETYYAKEGCWYTVGLKDFCDWPKNPPAEVHPPLGKWIIGLGVKYGGFDAVGWRVMAAFFGVIAVVALYLLARKILGSTTSAAVAGGLLAFDPLHFVHSRTALLDIFTATFALLAFLFVVYDRDAMRKAAADSAERRRWWARPWRLAAGLAAGAATASKWSGGLALVAVIVLTLVWEMSRRKENGRWKALTATLREELPTVILYMGVAPLVLYIVTYVGRLYGPVLDPLAEGSWAREWLRYQTNALDFHRNVDSHHGYESPPATWPLIKRPLLYWAEDSGNHKTTVYAMGNPFIWWPALAALLYTFVVWIRRRNWLRPEGFILLGFAATYLVWLVLAPRRDAVFLFYFLPALPFLHLALAYVIGRITGSFQRRIALTIGTVLAVGWFFLYYPIIAGVPISQERWDRQMFFHACNVSKARRIRTNTVTQAINRETTIVRTRTKTTLDKNIPPDGWCWE